MAPSVGTQVTSVRLLVSQKRNATSTFYCYTVLLLLLCVFDIQQSPSTHTSFFVHAYFTQCPDGIDGQCPLGNTCCVNDATNNSNHNSSNSSVLVSCIPNDLGSYNGTCCSNEGGGCGAGYTCQFKNGRTYCQAGPKVTDPLVQKLPRYHLCYPGRINPNFLNMYGWKITTSNRYANNTIDEKYAILPYYSSHGNLQVSNDDNRYDSNNNIIENNNITMAVIVIHGAGRNADDYFCSLLASVELYLDRLQQQQQQQPDYMNTTINRNNVLVIAPRFTLTTDSDSNITVINENNDTIIQWDGNDMDPGGPWRYGANAVFPVYASNISSYLIIDSMVHYLLCYPSITHISIIGHSSGGQFVQRWSFLTSTWDTDRMKGIVANPSSYVYLTNKRRSNNIWYIPSDDHNNNNNNTDCPNYNQWQFGLQPDNNGNGTYRVPYVNDAIHKFGIDTLIEQFRVRNVIYLIGSLDQCNVTQEDMSGWCFSHGLETDCPDTIQGRNRYERHWNYYLSLQQITYRHQNFNHERKTIVDVGHDHSLMFTSPIGLQSIFDPIRNILREEDDSKNIHNSLYRRNLVKV